MDPAWGAGVRHAATLNPPQGRYLCPCSSGWPRGGWPSPCSAGRGSRQRREPIAHKRSAVCRGAADTRLSRHADAGRTTYRLARHARTRRPHHRRRTRRPARRARRRRAGASVAIMSKVHPVRSHSNAAAGGINAALNPDDSWESHAFDTVKGSDYLGDQDAIEIMCREAPDEVLWLEHHGVTFHRNPEGKLGTRAFGGASAARTYYVADITGQALLHVLYEQLMKHHETDRPLRGVVRHRARAGRRRRLLRRDRPQHPRRRDGAVRRQVRDPRLRRRRPVLQADHQRAHLHRRRDRAGLPHRRPADGHGDDPVPPDHAGGQRDPHHRGRARRGRAPLQRRGRALHGEVRAQQARAGLARRRLALRADRDQRGPRLPRRHGRARHHQGAAQAHARGAARDRQHRARLRGRGHHARADPHQARLPLHHGRRQDRRVGRDVDPRPLRGRRGRLRLRPRRQPPRRQLAARHADLRPPLGRARRRARRRAWRCRAPAESAPRRRAADDRRDPRPREGRRPPHLRDQGRARHDDEREVRGVPRRGGPHRGAWRSSSASRRRPIRLRRRPRHGLQPGRAGRHRARLHARLRRGDRDRARSSARSRAAPSSASTSRSATTTSGSSTSPSRSTAGTRRRSTTLP